MNIPACEVLKISGELNGPWPIEFVAAIMHVYWLNCCSPVKV